MRGNPFKIIPEAEAGKFKTPGVYVASGNTCDIKYDFSFTAPPGKVIIVKGKRIEKLYKALRRTLKTYMREAEKDASSAVV